MTPVKYQVFIGDRLWDKILAQKGTGVHTRVIVDLVADEDGGVVDMKQVSRNQDSSTSNSSPFSKHLPPPSTSVVNLNGKRDRITLNSEPFIDISSLPLVKKPLLDVPFEKGQERNKAKKAGGSHGKLVVFYHEKCLDHNVPSWHLETPDRLRVAIEVINELSNRYGDERVFHVVRNPVPSNVSSSSPSSPSSPSSSSIVQSTSQWPLPSPYLSFSPLPSFRSDSLVLDGAPLSNPSSISIGPSSFLFPPSSDFRSSTLLPPFKLLSRNVIETCHDSAYLDAIISKIPLSSQPTHATQYSQDDREPDQGDTFVSSGTWEAAIFAASVVCYAVDYIAHGHYLHAFCAVRPPGHHAGKKGRTVDACSQGYCILNNVAIGAMYARNQYLFSKIAIVDFDVHHGNGTQEIIGAKEGFLFISIHVGDLYPHTDVSLHPGAVPKVFKKHFEESVIPKIEAYGPQLIILSSGFDGHKSDPTEGGMNLTKAEYRYVTAKLKGVALRYCGGKLISVLEGGYHLPSLKKCIEEHLTALASDEV